LPLSRPWSIHSFLGLAVEIGKGIGGSGLEREVRKKWSATVPVSFPFSFEKPVSFPCHDKGREGRQRIREDDDDNQCSLWVCSRRERKERGDERKKKARGILVHKI